MANALASASSPYLRQHADNPVNWHPWSQEALDLAARTNRPLLLSIGYSACHWCHVMARESFADPAVAEVMNEHFVCIKIDREERPDLDAIYLEACQLLTGHGGWPLHVFATPDGRPFWAGTYFPPQAGRGLPAWTQVLLAVAEAWRDRREELLEDADRLTPNLAGAATLDPGDVPPPALIDAALDALAGSFDSVSGGFGGAPKFPPHTALELLLRRRDLPMARYTLTAMASGGIFDQLAGGFARYAVDESWTVPHFEKMLDDNALLAARYAEAAVITGHDEFGTVAERTLDWAIDTLGDPDGGFASSLDAESGGEEGGVYTWTPQELTDALGEADAEIAAAWFGVTEEGDVDGRSVLEQRGAEPEPAVRDAIVARLLQARAQRPQPARDDKRVVSWNALMIQALTSSGVRLGRDDHLAAAMRCAELIDATATRDDGRLLRLIPAATHATEQAPALGTLDDHAHLLEAYVALHEATFDPRWYLAAQRLAEVLLRDFHDDQRGGFFVTGSGHETLIARRKDIEDSPLPAGQASAALALLRLHALDGDDRWLDAATGVLRLGAQHAARHPRALSKLLVALDQYHRSPLSVVIVGSGPQADALRAVVRAAAPAHAVITGSVTAATVPPILEGKQPGDGAAAYLCEGMTCRAPIADPDELRAALRP